MATTPSWLDDAFRSAKEDFKKSLKNPSLYDFSKINSPDDVMREAAKIEREQRKTKTLRGLRRIEPLINGLKEYAAVIEVFVQAKPEIMSLVWISSAVITAFDKVVKVIADLGTTLPSFKIYAQLFESNHDIRRALCLFYADILDFYAVLLNFLANRTNIQENMEHHKAIMTANVTLEDILRAEQARKSALEEHARAQAFRESQTFSVLRNELNPHNYDTELTDILRRSSVTSGNWLNDEPNYRKWCDPTDHDVRCLWLHGIPGSGKTFLVSNLIKEMQDSNQRVLFVFLSHDDQATGDTIKVLHSLIFQLLEYDATLRPILHKASESDYRKLKSDCGFVLDLLCTILNSIGTSYLILDGLDELNEVSWKHLLSTTLQIIEKCQGTKLLISSREEREMSLQLESKSIPLRVNSKNHQDIHAFVQLECEDIIDEKKRCGADEQTCIRIREALETITEKSEGKSFLKAKRYPILTDVSLPDGLDQAYGRLLDRIKIGPPQGLRNVVRTILQWIACAQRPLREEEILQALALDPGKCDFTRGRREFRDIFKACGPVIEAQSGSIRFVHFSAKEYFLHEQSGGFLNLAEAHLNAALLCTTYLSFQSLNPLFFPSPGEIDNAQKGILDGDYVMFEYASVYFLEHLKTYLQSRDPDLDILVTTLRQLQYVRGTAPGDSGRLPARFCKMFKAFPNVPELRDFLSLVAYTQAQAQLGLICKDGDNGAVHSLGILETAHPNSDALPIQPSSNMFDALKSAIILDQQQVVREMLIRIDKGAIATFNHQLAVALGAENLPNIKLLLSRGADISKQTYADTKLTGIPSESLSMDLAEMSGYTRALGTWNPNLLAYLVNECQVEFPEKIEFPEKLFGSPRISSYTPDEAMKRFDGMKQYIIWPETYVRGVEMAVRQARCAAAVRICLENGGDPNTIESPRSDGGVKKNMLYYAIREGGERAAEIVKVLLKHGADIKGLDLHIKTMRRKMKAIEKCFGYEWDEVVRRIQAGEDLAITPRRRKNRT
ncbi:hypothetical protein Daesc_000380 [Daldinia eschscholtzii]|uniref:NACHT domain-containing protein n=1 Tax=Daldinia eschscholtzii TaxID=292717 RepID=A0AAX6MYU3_9PEZI